MNFEWTDREGCLHLLTSPALIVEESDAIERQVDRLLPGLENADVKIADTARRLIAPLVARLEQCSADHDRWDAHADRLTLAAAEELCAQIVTLPDGMADAARVVALHDEHDEMLTSTHGKPEKRASMLADRMTVIQRRAFMAIDILSMPAETVTRGEGKAALDLEPRFARSQADTGGWFGWSDRSGHAHRLVDALPIERELVAVAGELTALLPALRDHSDPVALFTIVEGAVALWGRMSILRYDLERFGCEADARHLGACKQFAVDWRSKRNK